MNFAVVCIDGLSRVYLVAHLWGSESSVQYIE